VAGFCECGDEPSGSGAKELMSNGCLLLAFSLLAFLCGKVTQAPQQ
jgi:hypothetical protein